MKAPKIIKKTKVDKEEHLGGAIVPLSVSITIEQAYMDYFLDLQKVEVPGSNEALSIYLMYMHSIYFGPKVTRRFIMDRLLIKKDTLDKALDIVSPIFTVEE